MASRQSRALVRQVEQLRRQFLPRRFDPLGLYRNSIKVQLLARAFLVFSHAEIESFLEDWAKRIARSAEEQWQKKTNVTLPLASLLYCSDQRWDEQKLLASPASNGSSTQLSSDLVRVFHEYYQSVKDNHGIKERNVLNLFAPLGVLHADFGLTLLPNLDSLGVDRGLHAHQSAVAAITVIDPEIIYKRVLAIVGELVVLDGKLKSYLQ